MNSHNIPEQETVVLVGGPADGLWIQVPGRARTVQVTSPCPVQTTSDTHDVRAVYIYRRDPFATREPVSYGFDGASP